MEALESSTSSSSSKTQSFRMSPKNVLPKQLEPLLGELTCHGQGTLQQQAPLLINFEVDLDRTAKQGHFSYKFSSGLAISSKIQVFDADMHARKTACCQS